MGGRAWDSARTDHKAITGLTETFHIHTHQQLRVLIQKLCVFVNFVLSEVFSLRIFVTGKMMQLCSVIHLNPWREHYYLMFLVALYQECVSNKGLKYMHTHTHLYSLKEDSEVRIDWLVSTSWLWLIKDDQSHTPEWPKWCMKNVASPANEPNKPEVVILILLSLISAAFWTHGAAQMTFLIFLLLAKREEVHPAYHYTHEEGTPTRVWQECVYLQLQKEI